MRDLGLDRQRRTGCKHLFTQGMVIKDGAKMSKSKGNVVERRRDDRTYGADTGRLFDCSPRRPKKTWIGPTPARSARTAFSAASIDSSPATSDRGGAANRTPADKKALRKLHQTLSKSPTISRAAGTSIPRSPR